MLYFITILVSADIDLILKWSLLSISRITQFDTLVYILSKLFSSDRVDGTSPGVMSTPMKEKPWISHESLKDGPIKHIRSEKEMKFWKDLINRSPDETIYWK